MMVPFIEAGNTGGLDLDLEKEMQDISFWNTELEKLLKYPSGKWGEILIYRFRAQKGDLTGHLINLWNIRI